jgi:outer membrane lipoprotein-sorting protein
MSKFRATQVVLIAASCLLTSSALVATRQDAYQIVQEAQKRTMAKSQRYEGLLQTFEASGKTSEKRWIYERIGSHGQSRVLIRFTEPPEVRGVALLIVNHPDKASDQWMWTPALERDRRIALQDRSTRFFGTDFSFEDLEERDVDQSTYRLLGEEVIEGAACWKIETTPKESRSSQYTKTIIWIRKDSYAWARIDAYVKDEIVRRLEFKNIKNVQGIWTAQETVMTDLRRGSITRLALEKIEYNIPLREEDFTVEALRRK